MHKPYVYVLIREDISLEQKLVQASHAALEAGFRFEKPEQTASLIMLSVPDRNALEAAAKRLTRYGIEHHMFFEPDFEMGHSALATRPIHLSKERHRMRKYPLFRALESARKTDHQRPWLAAETDHALI
ncbi:hypothetical protein G3A43_06155 [Paraburkholderia aspalathi]|nr:hypothetical protein [Paraburkholderia aspalathi]MBK3779830.1 hypothetical protein [Paraburkholderia aspalathi]